MDPSLPAARPHTEETVRIARLPRLERLPKAFPQSIFSE